MRKINHFKKVMDDVAVANINRWMMGKRHQAKAKKPPPVANPNPRLDIFDTFVPKERSAIVKYESFLSKKGFRRIGSGAFSTVYAKPNKDRVLKVIRTKDNWIDYTVWASKEGYAGLHAPKVYSYKDHGDFAVAVVERLEYDLGGYRRRADAGERVMAHLLWDYGYERNVYAGYFANELAPGLPDFVSKIVKRFPGRLDLHGGNIMARIDGTYCVVDPVCGAPTGTFTRLKAGDFLPLGYYDLLFRPRNSTYC